MSDSDPGSKLPISSETIKQNGLPFTIGFMTTGVVKWFFWQTICLGGGATVIYYVALHQGWCNEIDFSQATQMLNLNGDNPVNLQDVKALGFNGLSWLASHLIPLVPINTFTSQALPALAIGALLGFLWF